MITAEVKKIIEENAVAFATSDKNRNPHCIAVGDVKVVSKNQILIGDVYLRKTIENIKRNNNVALAVWSRDWKKRCVGYQLKGKAQHLTSGKWYEKIKKIHKGFLPKGAILVTISKLIKLG